MSSVIPGPVTVGSYATETLTTRLIRESTLESYYQTLRLLGLWDEPLEGLTVQLLHRRLLLITNVNTRRKHVIALRSIFQEFPWSKALTIPKAAPRVYDLPDEQTLRFVLMLSPYELQGLLMMYAGLRAGEACAISPKDVRGNILVVNKQRDKHGVMQASKTSGEVVIPAWLAERVKAMEVKTVTPGSVRESFRRNGKKAGVDLNPHMLRHWYATRMVMNKVNPSIAQKQMRHSDLKTTLNFYVQFTQKDVTEIVDDLFGGNGMKPGDDQVE